MNISEGRRGEVLDALARAAGAVTLDVHADADHHRAVFTLGGEADAVENAARRLAREAVTRIDLREHTGAHPRLGVVDVVPFVALGTTPPARAIDAALAYARWSADELRVPAFLYGDADPRRRSLPDVRRDAFVRRAPDFGADTPRVDAGASAVGARPLLIAVNCELDRDDLALARAIARDVRERDGGLPGVRALGLALASRGRAQVSMNLVALERTGVEDACVAVRHRAEQAGASVERVELVGLLPASALERASREFLAWSGISRSSTIEARLDDVAAAASDGPAPADGA
ncbi:MAG TPA: glutamate formiminotransferase [Acidimicrobiia bacterium]